MNEPTPRVEKTDSTSTAGEKQAPRGASVSRTTHPPRPVTAVALDRKVSVNKKTADKHPSREDSQGTLDGEGIFVEDDNGEMPFASGAATSTTSNVKSPMLTSVSYPARHDRNSSLDAFSLGMESVAGSPNNNPEHKISLTIKTINPLESEAEALILKALDRQDQQQNAQVTNISLLGNVPDKTAAIIRSNSRQSSGSHQTSTLERPARSRTKTMEDELALLSDTLADLHNDINDEEELTIPEDLNEDDEDQVVLADGPAGETMAKTARLLYRGRNRTASEARPEDLDEDVKDNESKKSGDGSGVKSNWSKLRKVVSIRTRKGLGVEDLVGTPKDNDIPNDHKKTDDNVEANGDVEQGGVLNTNESSSGDKKGNFGRKGQNRRYNRFNQAQPGLIRDLQIFFSQRRSGFLSYVRFLVLVIVPSVAAAFCFYYLGGTLRRSGATIV